MKNPVIVFSVGLLVGVLLLATVIILSSSGYAPRITTKDAVNRKIGYYNQYGNWEWQVYNPIYGYEEKK